MRSGPETKIVTIILMQRNKDCTIEFPFKDNTTFLGLQGGALFEKLVVLRRPHVEASDTDSEKLSKGLRVFQFDGTESSAGEIVAQILAKDGATEMFPNRVLPLTCEQIALRSHPLSKAPPSPIPRNILLERFSIKL
jgi:hypothetical protein